MALEEVDEVEFITIILAAVIAAQWIIFLIVKHRRERELDRLTEYLMRVQDSLSLPSFDSLGEGKFGVLESELYKLLTQMSQQTGTSRKEKEYLSKMLSDISHQIKTPLTSMGIMVDLLKSPGLLEEKRILYAGNIERQMDRMTWLVRNLLTLSRLDADMLHLKKEQVNLKSMITRALEPFEIMAEVKEIQLEVKVDKDIQLVCDEQWTTEALSNIIKNSLEHTDSGGCLEIRGEKNNFSTNISFKDNGSGIAPEDLGHIFERFYKGKNSSENSVGIGLALSRQLIMLQNGIINVASELNKGTEFCIKMYSDVII